MDSERETASGWTGIVSPPQRIQIRERRYLFWPIMTHTEQDRESNISHPFTLCRLQSVQYSPHPPTTHHPSTHPHPYHPFRFHTPPPHPPLSVWGGVYTIADSLRYISVSVRLSRKQRVGRGLSNVRSKLLCSLAF